MCIRDRNNSEALCLFGTTDMSSFDDALEFRFKADTTWADAHEDDKAAVIRLWNLSLIHIFPVVDIRKVVTLVPVGVMKWPALFIRENMWYHSRK